MSKARTGASRAPGTDAGHDKRGSRQGTWARLLVAHGKEGSEGGGGGGGGIIRIGMKMNGPPPPPFYKAVEQLKGLQKPKSHRCPISLL